MVFMPCSSQLKTPTSSLRPTIAAGLSPSSSASSSGQDDGLLDALIRLSFSIGYISHLASQPANSK
jgi:hypothetical protein